MTGDLRLVIFDVDGTLVDSQGDIVAAMSRAFAAVDEPAPERADLLSIVGLSLNEAMAHLRPDLSDARRARMVAAYKDAYVALRAQTGVALSSPLYPGAQAALDRLQAVPDVLLGVATGKSRRGLDKLIEGHGLEGLFVTQQVADHHPSKPHPSMILQAMADTGISPQNCVMVGDTTFDMEMAASAGIAFIGVSWGYHDSARLAGAVQVVDRFGDLDAALGRLWSVEA